MAIPSSVFSGEWVAVVPPEEYKEISATLSDEGCELSFEFPRLSLEISDAEPLKGILNMQEWMWGWLCAPLRSAFSLLTGVGLKTFQRNEYGKDKKISEMEFVISTPAGYRVEKV